MYTKGFCSQVFILLLLLLLLILLLFFLILASVDVGCDFRIESTLLGLPMFLNGYFIIEIMFE